MAPGGGALVGQPEGVQGLEKWLSLPQKKKFCLRQFRVAKLVTGGTLNK